MGITQFNLNLYTNDVHTVSYTVHKAHPSLEIPEHLLWGGTLSFSFSFEISFEKKLLIFYIKFTQK